MHQVGARFLAESEIWRASEMPAAPQERAASDRDRVAAVTAPLGEFALVHMEPQEVREFVEWRFGLPEKSTLLS